ncbi:HNH endonuclease [Caldanaerobacter subterraneus]|uniref:HNH endonuclease n=1 Tax=Caldanaerobacter subterraneus TaxID=911092 RepID=UPI001F0DD383|nr:HNH endonuclease signature motif containing protein [Caldanaerobacter subterraneus]
MKRAEKLRIWQRDNYRCYYCGRRVKDYFPEIMGNNLPGDAATVDHIIPRSKGGKDIEGNLITACKRCNNLLGNFEGTLKEKKAYVQSILSGRVYEKKYKKAV